MMMKYDVTPLSDMLSTEIDPLSLKEKLAEIRYNYANYALKDEDACGGQPEKAEDAYYLKMLEERLVQILEIPASPCE